MSPLFQRLRRRRLFQWGLAYLAGAWLVFQGTEVLAEPWNLSVAVQRTIHVLLGAGFLITVVLAWYHGEKGRQRVSGLELLILAGILAIGGAAVVLFGRGPQGGAAAARSESVPSALSRKSVAVLPFVNVGGDSEDEIFSDGITFDIINHLSKIADLKVISRTSIMQYKNTQLSLSEVAEELGVATVLEGEVQKVGDRIRINVQLVDAQTDRHIWAEQYNRVVEDVFAVQSEVARKIALALQATMTEEVGERIARVPTGNLEAYNSYLLGRHWWNRRTAEGLEQAIGYFEDAIQRDSTFVLAYAGLADTYVLLPWYGDWQSSSVYPKALAAARRAVELDGGSGEARTSLAIVRLWYEWDFRGAEAEFERAIELSPSYATAHGWYAASLTYQKRFDEAIARSRIALALDPLSAIIGTNLGDNLYYARRYDEAIEQYVGTLELHPDFVYARRRLGQAYLQKQMYEEAEAELTKASRLNAVLAGVYTAQGRREEAHAVLEAAAEGSLESQLYALVGVGDIDGAFEVLGQAFERRAVWLLEYPALDPYFDGLRADARFMALRNRYGLE
ncbi:MAG: tetratricopeptide repeat protein [Gemmatimonadota bacterium]|nr:MAG: tetratricopeptide repeat protein [Gemmatimonadota bacterium]